MIDKIVNAVMTVLIVMSIPLLVVLPMAYGAVFHLIHTKHDLNVSFACGMVLAIVTAIAYVGIEIKRGTW